MAYDLAVFSEIHIICDNNKKNKMVDNSDQVGNAGTYINSECKTHIYNSFCNTELAIPYKYPEEVAILYKYSEKQQNNLFIRKIQGLSTHSDFAVQYLEKNIDLKLV